MTLSAAQLRGTRALVARQLQIEKEEAIYRARRGVLGFTCYTKHDYAISWHHRVICRALNAFARGEITRLMISMPPRSGKSELASRRLPAYLLGINPDLEIMAASYGATLAERMNRDVQRIMTSPEYERVFPGTRLSGKNIRNTAQGSWLRNSETFEIVSRRGRYQCAGIGGSLTGSGADYALIDDYLRNWQDANSKLIRDRHWEWYSSVLYTRLSKNGCICVMATRWHEDDLQGRLLAQAAKDPQADQWIVINLPAIKEDAANETDPRAPGEALWPERFPLPRLQKIRRNSERVFASLYQGRPAPPDGDIIKKSWWKRYTPAQLPTQFDSMGLSADLTFKDAQKNDWNVLQVWGRLGADMYLVHQIRAKMPFTQQVASFAALCQKYPEARVKWVEDAANGAALIDHVRKTIPGVVAVAPRGSKLARAEAIAPYVQAGNVHIPDEKTCPWTEAFLEEWVTFPNGTHDDQVDATSMAISRLTKEKSLVSYLPSLTKQNTWRGDR